MAEPLRTITVTLTVDEEGAPTFTPTMTAAVQEAVDLARRDGATALGLGTLCGLVVLAIAAGRDWKRDLLTGGA